MSKEIKNKVRTTMEGKDGIIKRAVKEALDDKRLEDLGKQMTDLATQMTAGFQLVHQRQDITNGKVLAHQAKFDKMDGQKGYDRFIWFLVTTLVGVVIFFITKGIH